MEPQALIDTPSMTIEGADAIKQYKVSIRVIWTWNLFARRFLTTNDTFLQRTLVDISTCMTLCM